MNFNRKRRTRAGIRYENNLNAPRMKMAKYTTTLVSKELHAKWLKTTEFKDVDFKRLKEIWEMFTEVLQDEVVTNPDGVRLGFYTGDLRLNYVNKYDPVVDEKVSEEVGKDVSQLNWNTNGKLGKVVWSINYARKRNKRCRLYAFHPEREFQRNKAGKAFKQTPEIYKDNRINKFHLKVKKDATNPWIHGMEVKNKRNLEHPIIKKRSYFEREEGPEGD